MATSFNKTSLKKEKDQLLLYQQFLPSLDLKRQQFLQERKKAKQQVAATEQELDALFQKADEWLPFLADERIKATGIVSVTDVRVGQENVLGLTLPQFQEVKTAVADYSMLSTPLWLDSLVSMLVAAAELTLRLKVERQRLVIFEEALQTITKRVNLFDRVLIPETRKTIRRIQLGLADMERTGVIRAKLAKNKKQTEEL